MYCTYISVGQESERGEKKNEKIRGACANGDAAVMTLTARLTLLLLHPVRGSIFITIRL